MEKERGGGGGGGNYFICSLSYTLHSHLTSKISNIKLLYWILPLLLFFILTASYDDLAY